MKSSLAPYRLRAQRLVGPPLDSPSDVVGHLGAVQSQLPDMALWAIGRRCGATLADVEQSFARAEFIRTHVLRPTWHNVLAADLRDLLEVTAPRIRQAMDSNNRRDGLERHIIERWAARAVDVVRHQGPLTRLEVEQHLIEAGFRRQGNSLAHVMIEAELTGEIHSGPVRGKQHTYVAGKLPASRRTPDERLAWLAQLYGQGHGPFRDKDLAWWTTLTLTQARRAVQLAGLESVDLEGERYHLAGPLEDVDVPRAMLLPAFDEFISYARDPDDYALVDGNVGIVMRAGGLLFVDGALAGTWTRAVTASDVRIGVAAAAPINRPIRAAIEAEADRYGAFVNRRVGLETQALR